MKRLPLLTLIAMLMVLDAIWLVPAVLADDEDDWRTLHEDVEAGRALALRDVLDDLERRYIGQVIEVELENEDGLRVYEVEMIGPDGQVVEFEVDAVSGEIIGMEGRNIRAMERP